MKVFLIIAAVMFSDPTVAPHPIAVKEFASVEECETAKAKAVEAVTGFTQVSTIATIGFACIEDKPEGYRKAYQ